MTMRARTSSRPRRCGRWPAVIIVAGLLGLQTLLGEPALADPLKPDCAVAPALERPGDGAVGSIDPPQGNGESGSLYLDYSYAGFRWNTYDQHVGPLCNDGFAGVTTWVGNGIFDIAKLLVGTTNSLHYTLKNGGFLGGLDEIVQKGSDALYQGAAVPFIAFALLLVAVAIFLYALRGDMASTSKATARVLAGLWIMAATALTPLAYTTVTDSVLVTGINELEANIYSHMGGNQDTVYRDVLPTMLHRKIIVENWARGEFGNYETDFAKQTTRELVDAQAWNWDDVRSGRDADNEVEKAKHEKFKKIAEQVKQHANYAAFTGDGAHRIGASVFALGEAVCMVIFQLFAKAAVVLAQLVLRITILAGPVIGLLAFAPGVARNVARAVAGVLVQGVILAIAAGGHALVMLWIADAQSFGGRFGNLVLMAVITIILWKALKPWRRLKNMAAAAVGVPALSRDTLRLEQLLKKQYQQSRRGLWHHLKRAGGFINQLGHRSVDKPAGWPGDAPRRPETVWNDGEVLRDNNGIVVHAAEPSYDYAGRARDPRRPVWADAEVVRTGAGSRTHDAYGRPELAAARAALPPGGATGGGEGNDSGSGSGRSPRGPGGGGTGGGGARAESGGTGHTDDRPVVIEGEIVPSELEERERWLDAEREENPQRPPRGRTDQPRKPQVYRPSTGRVEDDNNHQAQRPETTDGEGSQ